MVVWLLESSSIVEEVFVRGRERFIDQLPTSKGRGSVVVNFGQM
jgi:hypothetical protein